MSIKNVGKHCVGNYCALITLSVCIAWFVPPVIAQTAKLPLVGNIVPTLIDKAPNPARATDVVKKALSNFDVSVIATTQAWSGSGLRNGTYAGFIDHYSLNVQRNNYIYSQPYLVLPLHIASRRPQAADANRLDRIYRTTLGIENRFANTDELRSERSVRWARTPDFLANIKQLADRRVDNIIADKFMLDAFNSLLLQVGQDPMYLSREPIYLVELHLAIKVETPNAQSIIDQFNSSISSMDVNGDLDEILIPEVGLHSFLDAALYEDILRKW